VSAGFQTNRSEEYHKGISHKLPMLDSYLCSLPSSGTKIFIIAIYKENNKKSLKAFLHNSKFSNVKLI
jgi:hypothetical protein